MVYGQSIQGNVDALQDVMVSRVHQCLAGSGYRKFILTEAEQARIAKMKHGPHERFEYLHQMASRPDR